VPLEIVWLPLARARLQEIRTDVTQDKPEAAGRLASRIVVLIKALRIHPHLGVAGAEPGIRELVIGGTPYVVLYRVRGRKVIIQTIWHRSLQKEP
jgi:toxin ParE1/3/4